MESSIASDSRIQCRPVSSGAPTGANCIIGQQQGSLALADDAMAVLVLLLQLVSSNPMVAHADAASVLGRKAGVVDGPAAENATAWAREVRRHLRCRQHGEPAARL